MVVGGGFAGIEFIKELDTRQYQVVLLDRHNYHTFQPLLYQVATAGLEPDSIAEPLRKVFKNTPNFLFRVANVERVDTNTNCVRTDIGTIKYDFLVVATGTRTNYFGNDAIREATLPLKQIPHALDMRSHMLQTFEAALMETDPLKKEALLSFAIVGGGPTGVELAGSLSELRSHVLPNDYPELDFKQMKIHLIEGTGRVLNGMSDYAGKRALKDLQKFGVDVMLNALVDKVEGDAITLKDGRILPSANVVWAAGVTGNLFEGFAPEKMGRAARLKVNEFNQVEGFANVYALGDIATMAADPDYANGHPQMAPAAIQQGQHLGKNFNRLTRNQPLKPFRYFNKGVMATIGRNRAVVDLPWPKWSYGGFIAWLSWMFIHLLYLVGFRNKFIVLWNWIYNFFTYDHGTRLIIRPYIKHRKVPTNEDAKAIIETEATVA